MIGVLDWGIGGVDFLRQLEGQGGFPSFCYLSDTGAIPYGKMRRRDLLERVHDALSFLRAQACKQIVVACNAASTVLPELRLIDPKISVGVVGMIEPTLSEIASMREVSNVGVIGGIRTIRSLAYAEPLRKRGFKVQQRIAQPLSAMIESGDIASPKMQATLDQILRPLRSVDVLVLGCTHYPAVIASIKKHVPQADLLSPATIVSNRIISDGSSADGFGTQQWVTTGDPAAMRRAAACVYGIDIMPRRVTLGDNTTE